MSTTGIGEKFLREEYKANDHDQNNNEFNNIRVQTK